jgi:8-oxo-dGTP pyrophosphatase MutT (NUDIX family)
LDLRRLLAVAHRDPAKRVAIAPPLRGAAVALVLAPTPDDEPALLLLKRAEHPGDPWSGQMALPGGRHDSTDADLLATAIRETAEETGIALTAEQVLDELDDLSPVSPHLPPLVVRPFVFGLAEPPEVRLSSEATLHLWVPLASLARGRTEETVTVAGGRQLTVPGFRIGPHLIWGMTERIIAPLVRAVGEVDV